MCSPFRFAVDRWYHEAAKLLILGLSKALVVSDGEMEKQTYQEPLRHKVNTVLECA